MYRICVVLILLLTTSYSACAAQWLEEHELEFDIFDLQVGKELLLFESADVYYHQDRLLLPFYVVTNMLEVNLNYGPEQGAITGLIDGKTVNFNLDDNAALLHWPVLASRIGDELYLDRQTLEVLLNAKIQLNMKELAVIFSANSGAFPIEKRIERSNRLATDTQHEKTQSYDFLVEDQYRLFTPPKGHVNITARGSSEDSQLNVNLQTYGDLLYHASHLSLAHNDSNDLTARFNLRRSQTAPDKKILGVLNNYAFGDVSASNTRLQSGYSGLGLVFSSFENKYSSYFGKITIEEDAPANWQAELYKNGFLLKTGVVNAEGQIIFTDVDTTYGNNRFEIRLYGPYGEEQSIVREVLIGQKMLKPGELNFNGGLIDTGKSLFNNDNLNGESAPAAFFQTEYGIDTKTSLGLSYFVQDNTSASTGASDTLQEGILSLSRQIPNALVDLNLFVQEQDKYKVDVNILGSFNRWLRYNGGAFSNKNYTSRDATTPLGEQTGYRAGLTARFGSFGLTMSGFSKSNEYELSGVPASSQFDEFNLGLSSRFKKFNVSNTIKYSFNSGLANNVELTDQFAISTPIGDFWYLRTSANFNLENGEGTKTELDSIDVNATWRLPANIYSSFSAQYAMDDTYRVTSNVSLRRQKFNMIFGASYSSETQWQLNAGISFNIDYNHHTGQLNLQSDYSAASSTLDLLTFIDNNKNARFDEYDEPLAGVQFGIKPYWQNIRSSRNGLTYLPGLGHNAPLRVYFNTNETKAPNLKAVSDNFRFYTHAGGITSLDVPFNYSASVDGFIDDRTAGQTAKFVPVQILDDNGEIVSQELTDVENYFFFNDLWPGKFSLRIAPEFLAEKQLEATPDSVPLLLNGSEQVISLDSLVIDNATPLSVVSQLVDPRLRNGEFYSVQFGVYAERDYCKLRVEELKEIGVKDAFYSLATNYCKVLAGEFKTRQLASRYRRSIPREVLTDGFVTLYSQIESVYAILVDSFTSQRECTTNIGETHLISTYVINDNQRCKVYVGDFLTEALAQQALRELPPSLRRGARIVKL